MSHASLDHIYPVVCHESYLSELGEGNYFAADFGHDLALLLWHDHGGTLKLVTPSELSTLGVSKADLWNHAFENFNRALNQGQINFDLVGFPNDEKILVAGPHWLASTLAIHEGLYPFVAEQIGSPEVLVVVPAREKAIFFSKRCSLSLRSAVEAIAEDVARASLKPFGWRLLSLSQDGAEAIQ
ncbi:hypothetical protein [Methyloversatilis sp.]|uniref:hypothetical protein n=1 Tax=Methyloversatilis sp. TaxID=2569862 RepID=UPI0027B90F8C|nr:hypothetical protein [Methyloversatilis sp.]